MNTWCDIHNHLQDARLGDSREAARLMKACGVGCAVVNATRQADWKEVHALVAWSMGEQQAPELLPAYGIHPWHAATADGDWLDDLQDHLVSHPEASIGEIGLDGWVAAPSREVQRPVFLDQWQLARESKRPATIHCVKAWGALLEVLEQRPPTAPFLLHSYGGSPEVAKRLIAMGAYFSFSGHFLPPRKAPALGLFRRLPRERILLETDAPDRTPPSEFVAHPLASGLNHPANLPGIGRGLAAALGLSQGEVAQLTADNARRFLGRI